MQNWLTRAWTLQSFANSAFGMRGMSILFCLFAVFLCSDLLIRLEDAHSQMVLNSGDIDWWKGFDTNTEYFENYYKLGIRLIKHNI